MTLKQFEQLIGEETFKAQPKSKPISSKSLKEAKLAPKVIVSVSMKMYILSL